VPRDTITKTFTVAFLLCVACSVLVSSAAVVLRPTQNINKALDKKRNILTAAGLYVQGIDIDAAYQSIEAKVVDLSTGQYAEDIDAATYDTRRAAKDPATSQETSDLERAGIKRRAKSSSVYLVRKGDRLDKVILPVHGKGLWSTLYGFLALDAADLTTIKGLVFYEHAETPGLGGEVDNPTWKALWNGKQAFDAAGKPKISVIKGRVNPADKGSEFKVDGLSGATITSRGVHNMLRYWLSADGYGPYLAKLKTQGAA
jgi:Na+-transporting NADH:ubiquinone oxidoreductase subunit C